MFGLRFPELLLIILAIVLLFGATRLPQLAKSIGASRRAFKEGLREADDDLPVNSGERLSTGFTDDDLAAELARRRAAQTASK
ncbi:MAG: twin-arginine translocase TatA/TatE family subunit [Pyrinomonadaceae bacterium]